MSVTAGKCLTVAGLEEDSYSGFWRVFIAVFIPLRTSASSAVNPVIAANAVIGPTNGPVIGLVVKPSGGLGIRLAIRSFIMQGF
ncbi:MAG TPA: hypothetical protein DER02_04845 [Gammaproteobacteria bacterium]|nr:hypothetical protein [Gammaproteobacteria bacterium]